MICDIYIHTLLILQISAPLEGCSWDANHLRKHSTMELFSRRLGHLAVMEPFKNAPFECTKNSIHRDKTRVQMPAKMYSSFEFIMFAVYGPHSWF